MSISIKDQIISVATELFMNQGYKATSTRDIAKILNVTQPAIYHHYKNKEEIYAEVLKRFALEIGHSIRDILNQDGSFEIRLIETSIYLKNNHALNFALMMNDIEHELSDEVQRAIFIIWQHNYFQPFRDFFDKISPYLRPELNSKMVTRHYLRLISAYITNSSRNTEMVDEDIKTGVRIFLRGIVDNKNSFEVFQE